MIRCHKSSELTPKSFLLHNMKLQTMKLTCMVLLYSLGLPFYVAGRKIMFVLNTENPPGEGSAYLEPRMDLENTIQKSESIHRVLLRRGTASPNEVVITKSKGKKSKGIHRGQSYSYAYNKRELRAANSHEGQNHSTSEIATQKKTLRYQVGNSIQSFSKVASKRSVKGKFFDSLENKSYGYGKRKKITSKRLSNPLGRTHGTRDLKHSKQSKKKLKNETKEHVGNYNSNVNDHSYPYGHRDVQEDSNRKVISRRTAMEQFAWGREMNPID